MVVYGYYRLLYIRIYNIIILYYGYRFTGVPLCVLYNSYMLDENQNIFALEKYLIDIQCVTSEN